MFSIRSSVKFSRVKPLVSSSWFELILFPLLSLFTGQVPSCDHALGIVIKTPSLCMCVLAFTNVGDESFEYCTVTVAAQSGSCVPIYLLMLILVSSNLSVFLSFRECCELNYCTLVVQLLRVRGL